MQSCPQYCGVSPSVRGNGAREAGESCGNCPKDCGSCPTCTTDADCVPDACCYPSRCVLLNQAPVCNGVACSTECAWFSMDCGQGYCACQGGECVAVLNRAERPRPAEEESARS